MKDSGFLRVAAAVPQVKVGRAMENAEEILRMAGDASKQGVQAISPAVHTAETPAIGIP